MWDDEEPIKRSLSIREKRILYERSSHKCEACEKSIDFLEMQVGHKREASRGGNATLRNTVSLCYKCNNLMATDSWNVFLNMIGKRTVNSVTKNTLKTLTVAKLKSLAKKYNVKAKGRTEENWFSENIFPPTKAQYINTLTKKSLRKRLKKR